MICCLLASGKPLTDLVRNVLLNNAVRMYNSQRSMMKIVNDDVEGIIRTDFKEAALGSDSGVMFQATVSTSDGETVVDFLVTHFDLEDLEKGQWIDLLPPKKKRKKLPRDRN